ncbi:hypothetical protein IAD21_02010 [Abditibacteriota bacterium]|nr:hypothetical protein IAD21_02010 [Abditibacteriota bacterium]
MNPEPPPIPAPHSTHSTPAKILPSKEPRSPLSTLLWGVMSFVCLGLDAFLLLMLLFFVPAPTRSRLPISHTLFLLLLTLLVLLLTGFSLRQCFRRN